MDFKKFTLNQKLGILAIFLGFIALLMPDPLDTHKSVVDVNEIAAKMNDETIYINPTELADDIIQGKADFMLIDLNDEKVFNEYHIPFSVNYTTEDLNPDNIPRNERIIIYSNDNIKSAQAWFLLKAQKYRAVYLLKGGLSNWKECILFPKLSEGTTAEEKARNSKLVEVSKFFGGQPRLAGIETEESFKPKSLPKPKIGNVIIKRKKEKPKREGC